MFWLNLHKLRRRLLTVSARVLEAVVIVVVVLAGGLGSSWYMVEAGSRLTTARYGPWLTWTSAARPDADPYTRAHFANAGTLPLSTEVERSFIARTDSGGERLHSSCEYVIEGRVPTADWWSIAVFDASGALIPNPAGRHAFTGQTIALSSTGAYTVAVAREARAGNWLPTKGAGRLAVVLAMVDNKSADLPVPTDATALPTIKKLRCR
jgi:hypothetical protein